MTAAIASRLRSMTMRMPSRSDSSRMSRMPSIFPLRTRSAIAVIRFDLLTMNGISVTMMLSEPFWCVSVFARARMTTRPRPVVYASRIPLRPKMMPPVGKSGPLTILRSSSSGSFGSSMTAVMPSASSPRFCGGTLVAMPTAMPVAPFIRRFGSFAGRTMGSSRVSS